MTPSESYKQKSIKFGKICSWTVIMNSLLLIVFIFFRTQLPRGVLVLLAELEGLALIVAFVTAIISVISDSWAKKEEKQEKKID
jgi:hypothetical protein